MSNMAHEVITIFEDRKQKVNLTKTQIETLLSFKSILGQQNIRVDYDGSIQIMHYVGFIAKGDLRLQILPKIYENTVMDTENKVRESMKVLMNLLRVSEFNKVLHLPEHQETGSYNDDLLEIFISIFAKQIIKLYSRKMHREYVDIEENSSFIKGKINFVENTKVNLLRRDKHMIRYQSFEQDNLINNVIKSVALRLLTQTNSSENKKQLKSALVFLDDASQIQISKTLIESAKFTRLNMDFKPVYDMAKMFYLNLQPGNSQGEEASFTFLTPVNELFEYYVYKLLEGLEGYEAKYQNKKSFATTFESTNVLTIKPDIILYKDKEVKLIVDAKYKNPLYEKGTYNNISQSDIYQVFAYAKAYGVRKVALVYPVFDEKETETQTIKLMEQYGVVELVIGCVDIKEIVGYKNKEKQKELL